MDDMKISEKAYKNLDFLKSREARTIRILSEYLEPLTRLEKHKVNNWVLFFGSARIDPDDKTSPLYKYYWEAEDLADSLSQWAIKLEPGGKNFVICTGGGPGIMEAANRGAHRSGGKSIGMNISIPHEQIINPYSSPELTFTFHYFFMRKFWLVYKAKAIVAFPGGYGTLRRELDCGVCPAEWAVGGRGGVATDRAGRGSGHQRIHQRGPLRALLRCLQHPAGYL